jgi:hypothetical protein
MLKQSRGNAPAPDLPTCELRESVDDKRWVIGQSGVLNRAPGMAQRLACPTRYEPESHCPVISEPSMDSARRPVVAGRLLQRLLTESYGGLNIEMGVRQLQKHVRALSRRPRFFDQPLEDLAGTANTARQTVEISSQPLPPS